MEAEGWSNHRSFVPGLQLKTAHSFTPQPSNITSNTKGLMKLSLLHKQT